MLGVPIFLLRTAAEIIRQPNSQPSPAGTISGYDFDTVSHSDSVNSGVLERELKSGMEVTGRKGHNCLSGFEENVVASAAVIRDRGDAVVSRLPASVMPLDSDECRAQSAHTEMSLQDDVPSSALRQMLTVSVMLLTGSDHPKGILGRFLGADKQQGGESTTDRVSGGSPKGRVLKRGNGNGNGKGKASSQNNPEYDDSLREMHLCECIYCLKERELEWQLFLLREQHEATISNRRRGRSQPLLMSSDHYCPAIPRIGSNLDKQHQLTSTSGSPYFQTASRSPQPQFYKDPQFHKDPQFRKDPQFHKDPQFRKDPQNKIPFIHRIVAFLTFQFIIFLHFLYPRIKALIQGLITIERRHRLRERATNKACVLIHWIWRVLVLGAIGWILADSGTGTREHGHGNNQGVQGEEGKTTCKDEDVAVVRQWIKKSVREIVGGVCEGVEVGVRVWCGDGER